MGRNSTLTPEEKRLRQQERSRKWRENLKADPVKHAEYIEHTKEKYKEQSIFNKLETQTRKWQLVQVAMEDEIKTRSNNMHRVVENRLFGCFVHSGKLNQLGKQMGFNSIDDVYAFARAFINEKAAV